MEKKNNKKKLSSNMNITFDKEKHEYQIDGKTALGVTSVIDMFPKNWLLAWGCKVMAEEIKDYITFTDGVGENLRELTDIVDKAKSAWRRTRDKAGDTGTDIHSLLEDYIKGQEVICTPEQQPIYNQFLEFVKKYNPKWLKSEQIVGHKEFKYCGTFDALAEIDGKIHLIDFKTSSGIKDTYSVQLTAYLMAYNSMELTPKIDYRSILWLPKTGKKYEFKTYDNDIELDWKLFTSALEFCKWFKIWDSKKEK